MSYYDEDGNHLWTFDFNKVLCIRGIDAQAQDPAP